MEIKYNKLDKVANGTIPFKGIWVSGAYEYDDEVLYITSSTSSTASTARVCNRLNYTSKPIRVHVGITNPDYSYYVCDEDGYKSGFVNVGNSYTVKGVWGVCVRPTSNLAMPLADILTNSGLTVTLDNCLVEESDNKPREDYYKDIVNSYAEVNLSDFIVQGKTHSECIDECLLYVKAYSKKKIHFDVPLVTINKAILLDSGTTLLLENCKIKMADGVYDNMIRSANVVLPSGTMTNASIHYIPSYIKPLHDISIIGDGDSSIEGSDVAAQWQGTDMIGGYYGVKAITVSLVRVDGVTISGFSTSKPKMYTFQFEHCKNVDMHDVDITSNGVRNGDGIDVRTGCKNVHMYNITGCTGDDLIAINSAYTDQTDGVFLCPLKYSSIWETSLDKEDMEINGVFMDNIELKEYSNAHAILMWATQGIDIKNVVADNVEIKGGTYLPAYSLGYITVSSSIYAGSQRNAVIDCVRLFNVHSYVETDNPVLNSASSSTTTDIAIHNIVGTQGQPLYYWDQGSYVPDVVTIEMND